MSGFRDGHVRIDDCRVHVVEAGDPDAPPIVLLHGWPQSWLEWRELMALAAADGFRVIAVDLPGVGGSSPATANGFKRELASVVHSLIEQLDLDRATLVGHDIGGMTAYAYLRSYDDVASVVILDVVIPGIAPWDEVIRNPYIWHFALHAIPALPELLVQGHQAQYFDYFFDVLAVDRTRITPDARRAYAHAYASEDALRAGFDFYRAFPHDAEHNLAGLDATTNTPVLYLRGAGSRGDIDSYAQGLRAVGVPTLTAKLVAGAGHFIPEEQPAELWRLIHEFVTTTASEPGKPAPSQ
jgi:pimeloyl-ACP methyl ester carboxylesterase